MCTAQKAFIKHKKLYNESQYFVCFQLPESDALCSQLSGKVVGLPILMEIFERFHTAKEHMLFLVHFMARSEHAAVVDIDPAGGWQCTGWATAPDYTLSDLLQEIHGLWSECGELAYVLEEAIPLQYSENKRSIPPV